MNIDNETAEKIKICKGVGQGTILGPTLFKLYIYDFQKQIENLTLLFAEDTTLVVTADNLNTLEIKINEDLKKISTWLFNNSSRKD